MILFSSAVGSLVVWVPLEETVVPDIVGVVIVVVPVDRACFAMSWWTTGGALGVRFVVEVYWNGTRW